MLDEEFLWYVTDGVETSLMLWTAECIFTMLVIDEFESFVCVVFQTEVGVIILYEALILGENHRGRSEQFAFICDLIN